MNNEMKNQVIDHLKSYPVLIQKRDILRYELDHPATVSNEEMLEAMSFFKGSGSGVPLNSISDKTMYIAMNYREKANRLNAENRNDIVQRLILLEREIERMEFYVKMLSEREQAVIRKCYFEGKQQQEAAQEMGITTWTVRKYRDSAISKLTEMYTFAEGES